MEFSSSQQFNRRRRSHGGSNIRTKLNALNQLAKDPIVKVYIIQTSLSIPTCRIQVVPKNMMIGLTNFPKNGHSISGHFILHQIAKMLYFPLQLAKRNRQKRIVYFKHFATFSSFFYILEFLYQPFNKSKFEPGSMETPQHTFFDTHFCLLSILWA